MLTLSLFRHAKSSWGDPDADDFDRDLAPRGIDAAPRMGRAIRDLGLAPDLILCSTAIRARATLALALPEIRLAATEVRYEDALYMAPPEIIHLQLASVPHSSEHVMIVGHNPGLHAFALQLANEGEPGAAARLAAKYPTAALAVLTFKASRWPDVKTGSGRLEHFVSPKTLKD